MSVLRTLAAGLMSGGGEGRLQPDSVQWLFNLERRAILPVKWLMCLLCIALMLVRAPEHLPPLSEFVLLVFYLVSNITFSYLIYLGRVTPGQLRTVSLASFTIDVFVMASFIYLTGGIDSDFFILFFVVILRGMGFFPSARMNVLANIAVGLIYAGTLVLAGFDSHIMYEQEFYEKILLVVGVVLLSWFLIEIQAQQREHLMEINRQLAFEHAYVQNLLESMTDGVIAFDESLRVTTINQAARQILGLPPSEVEISQRGLESRIPLPILQACQRFHQMGVETTDETLEIALPDSRKKTIRLSTRGLRHLGDEPAGVVALFEDLSTMRRIEEQLLQSEKLASVGQLAAGVAHELGNPIGIIKACAEYLNSHLRKGTASKPLQQESLAEEINVIASEAERCQRILKQLLSYSSQEAIELENLELNELVHRAEGLITYNIPSERIRLDSELSAQPLWVKADSNLLTQALVNLLLNAIQAIQGQGRIVLRTFLESVVEGSPTRAAVEVEDTGGGIAPEQLRRVFEPFYTTRKEGTGLGLAITQRIVDRLGGQIEVESKVGQGSRFRIWLPLGVPTVGAALGPSGA